MSAKRYKPLLNGLQQQFNCTCSLPTTKFLSTSNTRDKSAKRGSGGSMNRSVCRVMVGVAGLAVLG
jgi:hypothetical protein